MPGPTHRTNRGFTLIELLVCVAIIATLASIILPVFASARESARLTRCLSNTKQLGTAMQLYLQDYDDRLPFIIYRWHDGSQTAFNTYYCQLSGLCQFRWADMIFPYVKNLQVYSCPSDITDYPWSSAKLARLSYGLNGYTFRFHGGQINSADSGPGPYLSEVARPAEHILLAETSNTNDAVALWCFRAPQMNHDRQENDCALKHGRMPAVYFDGHAKTFKMRGLLDQPPYNDTLKDCSQNWPCIQRYYPEWASWMQ